MRLKLLYINYKFIINKYINVVFNLDIYLDYT